MPHLTLGEVCRNTVRLQVTDPPVAECVHSSRCDTKLFAKRLQNPSANVTVFQWRGNSRLKYAARSAAVKMLTEHSNGGPPPQRLRIMQKYVAGESLVQIGREERRDRETVARIVKSEEMQEFVRQMREQFLRAGR